MTLYQDAWAQGAQVFSINIGHARDDIVMLSVIEVFSLALRLFESLGEGTEPVTIAA